MNKAAGILERTRQDVLSIFLAGVEAVAPDRLIEEKCRRQGSTLWLGDVFFDLNSYEQIIVIGAGKATAQMAASLEDLLGEHLTAGTIVVKYGHTCRLQKIATIEAAHPVPDSKGERGSEKILELARNAGEKDLLICLFSGGGSALLPMPVPGISLADKQQATDALLSCGATIHEINTLRKHLSMIKGGQLALAAYPATVVSLILSDVVGDDLDVISSGPTVPDNSTFEECFAILDKYELNGSLPGSVIHHLERGRRGEVAETPTADSPAFASTKTLVIGSNFDALTAAEKKAQQLGYSTIILSSMIEGETADVAKVHAAIAKEIIKTQCPLKSPACIISGGETTVTLKGSGRGGRNQEFALNVVKDIAGPAAIVMLSGGTDGNDGPTDATGAVVDNSTLERAIGMSMDIDSYLLNNDSYSFFKKLKDLIITGPTNTNVMDIRLILVP